MPRKPVENHMNFMAAATYPNHDTLPGEPISQVESQSNWMQLDSAESRPSRLLVSPRFDK
jgi:hypothetical protein